MRPADLRSKSVSFREKGRRDLARAASVPLKSFPKKGTHDDDIPLSLRMSGQFCTSPNRLAQLPITGLLDRVDESPSEKTIGHRLARVAFVRNSRRRTDEAECTGKRQPAINC